MGLSTDEASRSNFFSKMKSYLKIFEECKKKFESQTHASVEDVLLDLFQNDDEICMTLLWFLVDPTSYCPKSESSFLRWPIPTVNMEFDHRGCWKEISSSHYFYEGGESKGTYANCIPLFLGFVNFS